MSLSNKITGRAEIQECLRPADGCPPGESDLGVCAERLRYDRGHQTYLCWWPGLSWYRGHQGQGHHTGHRPGPQHQPAVLREGAEPGSQCWGRLRLQFFRVWDFYCGESQLFSSPQILSLQGFQWYPLNHGDLQRVSGELGLTIHILNWCVGTVAVINKAHGLHVIIFVFFIPTTAFTNIEIDKTIMFALL